MNGLNLYPKNLFTKFHQLISGLVLASVMVPQVVLATAITPSAIIELTNTERVKNGQTELVVDTQLTIAAYVKAQNMIDYGYFDHFGPHGETPWQYILAAGYDYHLAGENLAMNFDASETTHNAWMQSATHRDNILEADFENIGVAVVDGVIEGDQTTLVVQMFGTKQPDFLETLNPTVTLVEYVGDLLGIPTGQ